MSKSPVDTTAFALIGKASRFASDSVSEKLESWLIGNSEVNTADLASNFQIGRAHV